MWLWVKTRSIPDPWTSIRGWSMDVHPAKSWYLHFFWGCDPSSFPDVQGLKLKNKTSTYKTLPSRMPDWMWRFYQFSGYSDVCCFDPYQKIDYTREDGRHPWRAKPSAPFSVRQRTSSLFATWYTQQKTSPVTNHVDFIQHFPQLIWLHDIHVKSIPWVLVEFVLNWFVCAIGSETEGVVV